MGTKNYLLEAEKTLLRWLMPIAARSAGLPAYVSIVSWASPMSGQGSFTLPTDPHALLHVRFVQAAPRVIDTPRTA